MATCERGEDMYGEWTCDDCGCEITEDNECPDEDLPFCEECFHDLEECEECTRKFKESDGMFNDDNKFRCYDCHETQNKKVHPIAQMWMKELAGYHKEFKDVCEEQNLMIYNDLLDATPYSLGAGTLAGWGSADDFARARGLYEYEYE